jgi:HTH domain
MATKRQKKPPAPEAAAPPEFDMSDPSSSSYGEGARFLRDMLDPSARITDAGARVLHLADRTMAGLPEGGRIFLARSRELFARSMATIDNADLPLNIRQAIDTAIRETFKIAELKGSHDTVQFERQHGPRERASHAAQGRSGIVPEKAKKVSEMVKDKDLALDKRRKKATIDELAEEMKRSRRSIYRYLEKV